MPIQLPRSGLVQRPLCYVDLGAGDNRKFSPPMLNLCRMPMAAEDRPSFRFTTVHKQPTGKSESSRSALSNERPPSILESLFRRPIGLNKILNFVDLICLEDSPDCLNRLPIASHNEVRRGQFGHRLLQPARHLAKV
jgi:hypothetical protein